MSCYNCHKLKDMTLDEIIDEYDCIQCDLHYAKDNNKRLEEMNKGNLEKMRESVLKEVLEHFDKLNYEDIKVEKIKDATPISITSVLLNRIKRSVEELLNKED